ncbi:dual specificity protein phosphatase [Achlya hypogyna]|uniref:protein-tyrosine-phosphatase n=1 Tax=Achlya hypogyna TaxID=1202772 RepID=A0A1V9ZEX2_ACHHY|nr:dual specificity protein phosphatase [Achlya hypogyna]
MLAELLHETTARAAAWASEIAPGLWLGNGSAAADLVSLQQHGVEYVLNVADDVPNYHADALTYCTLGVADFGQDAGISRVFSRAFDFLDHVLLHAKGRVLVHCAAGANRSATVVIAYLMHSQQLSLADAWAIVRKRRPGMSPLEDNRKQLWNFELQLRGCHSLPSLDALHSHR